MFLEFLSITHNCNRRSYPSFRDFPIQMFHIDGPFLIWAELVHNLFRKREHTLLHTERRLNWIYILFDWKTNKSVTTRLKSYPRNSGELQSHSAKWSGSTSSLKKQLSFPVFSHGSTVWIPIIANILKSSFILWSKKMLTLFMMVFMNPKLRTDAKSYSIIKTTNRNLSIQQFFNYCIKENLRLRILSCLNIPQPLFCWS